MQTRTNQKLPPKYFGPFKIVAVIGRVAYKLLLPPTARIHDVFHVSQLRAVVGQVPMVTNLPSGLQHSSEDSVKKPVAILDTRMTKFQNKVNVQYLISWKNSDRFENSWEDAEIFLQDFPAFADHN